MLSKKSFVFVLMFKKTSESDEYYKIFEALSTIKSKN